MRTLWHLILALTAFLSLSPIGGEASMAVDPAECLECHADSIDAEAFGRSVHSSNACTSCHVDVTDLEKHQTGEIEPAPVRCARCHKEESAAHYASVHMLSDIGCSECHLEIHEMLPWDGGKERVVEVCAGCHETGQYEASVHGEAVREGVADSAACHDCHNLHEIEALGDPGTEEYRLFHTRVCLNCHGDREMMERNRVFPLAVETYFESYHGKSYRLGFGGQVAGCVDCHSAHHILPEDNPDSTINPGNLVEMCRQCHPEATARFAQFYVHGDHRDSENYPVLFWTFVLMTALVVAVFTVFWIHTLLWMFRGFVENRQRESDLAEGRATLLPDRHKLYRRFRKRHILLHLIVIVSFLGLSLSGLPLKFSDHSWAKAMMSFYGGVQNAGLIHRACAILTFYYFFVALAMSFQFLFMRRDVPGNWLQRLFGPDSLMPNFKDLRDVRDMVRWFLFRGPKPQFERWTYWEKFDFFAVFWGMFAIGGSGLLLWFPEFFSHLFPGWIFNVATIIHSDEALLATGFIFTVHFFNTHGRPEKFPMDFVIFNGELSKEEFVLERGEQWRRYEELGVTEDFRVRKSSGILYDFILKGFGFCALFTGLVLAFLIFSAFIWG